MMNALRVFEIDNISDFRLFCMPPVCLFKRFCTVRSIITPLVLTKQLLSCICAECSLKYPMVGALSAWVTLPRRLQVSAIFGIVAASGICDLAVEIKQILLFEIALFI